MLDTIAMSALTAAVAITFVLVYLQQRKAARGRDALRAAYFDDCKPLFTGGEKAIALTGFPRLSASYAGHSFDLQAVPDTLTFRKLPTLWLLVTIPGPMPVSGTFDMMIRPTGIEPFSKFQSLPLQIAPPPGFPPECAIRTDEPNGLPPEAVLLRHLAPFTDPRAKELVISPKGVRIVWLAQEADRGKYLIFRDAELGMTPLDPDILKPLLDYLIALREDVMAGSAATPQAEPDRTLKH
jgi:hypothetical protein